MCPVVDKVFLGCSTGTITIGINGFVDAAVIHVVGIEHRLRHIVTTIFCGDRRAGSNIGIIRSPLTEDIDLVAATRPIPNGWTFSTALSQDGESLFATYPGIGSTFIFNVDEIINTIENPSEFRIDEYGYGSDGFFSLGTSQVTAEDLTRFPIDNINPEIAIASDLRSLTPEPDPVSGDIEFGVPDGSNRAPLRTGGNPHSISTTGTPDLDLDLITPLTATNDLTPTLQWQLGEDFGAIEEVNLFISAYGEGEGLLPWDEFINLSDPEVLPGKSTAEKRELLTRDWDGYDDFNPGRILTATWKQETNTWYAYDQQTGLGQTWAAGDVANSSTSFTLPQKLMLTAGQTIHWAVQAESKTGTRDTEFGQFTTAAPAGNAPFRAVPVLTHGFTILPSPTGIPESHYQVADQIAKSTDVQNPGLILRYDKPTGNWIPVDSQGRTLSNVVSLSPSDTGYMQQLASAIKTNYLDKPLVLLPEWSTNKESIIPDAGFTEAAADAIFAAMVSLDQALMEVDDTDNQGLLLDSPLHFIGFSRGTVVNSEIIQRLGTYYPNAGGVVRDENGQVIAGDLHMTTIDPHDFDQPSLGPVYRDFKEPEVTVWDNVTFADNYYQTVPDRDNGFTFTPSGRKIEGIPEGASVELNGKAGFTNDGGFGGPHLAAFAWYSGTVGFDIEQINLDGRISRQYPTQTNSQPIFDRLGEGGLFTGANDGAGIQPWYSQAGSTAGLGTGWFYSVLGGGKDQRPDGPTSAKPGYEDNTSDSIQTNNAAVPSLFDGDSEDNINPDEPTGIAPVEDNINPSESTSTTPVYEDNTNDSIQTDSAAVPTLFNGDFEHNINTDGFVRNSVLFNGEVAGWSLHGNHDADVDNPLNSIVDWSEVSSLNVDTSTSNNVFKIQGSDGGSGITHNPFRLPDGGVLRLDVHVPVPSRTYEMDDYVKVILEVEGKSYELTSNDLANFVSNPPKYDAIPPLSPDVLKRLNPASRVDASGNGYIPSIDLREVDPLFGIDANGNIIGKFSQPHFQSQVNRVGYASKGFETFHLNIPQELYGKVAKSLRIEVHGNKTIYIDNISFGSEHLALGNPTLNGQAAGFDSNNYLIEKPEYAASYNDSLKTPNWVSYRLDSSWSARPEGVPNPDRLKFSSDYALPFSNKVESYAGADLGYGTNGHQLPRGDRFRVVKSHNVNPDSNEHYYIAKDQLQTFLTTNAFPESTGAQAWGELEKDLTSFINTSNGQKEAYVVTGRDGSLGLTTLEQKNILVDIPEYLWKVVLIPGEIGQTASEVDLNAKAFGVLMDNAPHATRDWVNSDVSVIVSIDEIEDLTGLDLFSDLPDEIEAMLEQRKDYGIIRPSAPLLAFEPNLRSIVVDHGIAKAASIRHDSVPENGIRDLQQLSNIDRQIFAVFGQSQLAQIGSGEISTIQERAMQCGTLKPSAEEISIVTKSIFEDAVIKCRESEVSSSQITVSEINQRETRIGELNPLQVGIAQIDIAEYSTVKDCPSQIDLLQTHPFKACGAFGTGEMDTSESSFASVVPSNQFLTAYTDWSNALTSFHADSHDSSSVLHDMNLAHFASWLSESGITFKITNLPTGQLAEAQLTRFDANGHPIAGTILIDNDANGTGWFIDPTPLDNSEFRIQNSEFNLQATADSAAYGRYDLLTTLLHELGHLAGFISGYTAFDQHVQDGSFTAGDITAPLSADGSHLADPYRLLSPYLAPGVRKLPSELELQILDIIRSTSSDPTQTILSAPHSSTPLVGITNGDFEALLEQWHSRGAVATTQLPTSTAVSLTEDSPLLSQLSQTFIVPEDLDQRFLTFDLIDTTLGSTEHRPPDAFEVALLDTLTLQPLVGTAIGLTHTDALLNLQADGTLYTDDDVTVTTLSNGDRRVTIDLGDLAPSTTATLYFDLLGFGAADSTVTIDNVSLGKGNTPPVATDDTATLTQGQSLRLDLLSNDTDPDEPLTPDNIQLTSDPTHGTLSRDSAGHLIYTPYDGYVGSDSFSYVLTDREGDTSAPATVTLNIANLAPEIQTVTLPDAPTEGSAFGFTATATDPGNDTLTYTWDFGDGTDPVLGQTADHSYADDGTYTVTLTVSDPHGGSTTETQTLEIDNTAPVITAINGSTEVNGGESLTLSALATDPGDDTPTYTWDFGDGSDIVIGSTAQHTFADNGLYPVTLTVTDEDGGITTQTLEITVNNVAPSIINITSPDDLSEGSPATFSATATDPGDDTLTYTWDFGDGTIAQTGQTVDHTYGDNGTYTVTLTVTDDDGAETVETQTITVNNLAPVIADFTGQATADEGEAATFSATATDPGDDTLTYTWDFGDGSPAANGQTAHHTFLDNGTYTVTLTVTDKDGAATTETREIVVNNVAPIVIAGDNPEAIEGQAAQFNGSYTDPGILDTHTVEWDFGDGSAPVTNNNPGHIYTEDGSYTVTLTVQG
ncbi:MAG: PKD domain-containing protein [Leptolyngbya sp. SIOISBB]|nr:PKD domain-containing protein [Leptolyngbya sp. SIOISBB]